MTATSGTSEKQRRFGRRQIVGAVLAAATFGGATVALVGSGVDDAEAAFGATPPPATTTMCETDHPAEAEAALNGGALDWGDTAPVTIDLFSRDGDASSPTFGAESPYTGDFTYAVVLDNAGDPFDPAIENHPSYHPMASSTPVVLTGGDTGGSVTVELPRGCRYLMSVRAEGHDLGGSWIRIEDGPSGAVVANDVYMVTNEALPLAQVVVRAFHDFAQVNAQFDVGETGLEGFDVVVGDGGERAVDYFGNPICTNYELGGDGVLGPDDLDGDGLPTIAADPGGNCLTDENGFVTIQYLEAGKYELLVHPPDSSDWVQTTTIEGTQVIDAWLVPGDAGIGGEFIGDIDAGTFQAVGFVSGTITPDPNIDYQYPYTADAGGGDITGCFFNGQLYPTAEGVTTVVQNGIDNPDGTVEPLFNSYVALNDVGNHDSMMALVETDANGCFRFDDVPRGTYQLTVWDYELLYIIGFYNVTVDAATIVPGAGDAGLTNGVVDMGDMFVLRWRGWASGHVFYDSGIAANGTPIPPSDLKDGSTQAAANGVRDCLGQNAGTFVYDDVDPELCEAGIPEQEVLIRNRDGSVFAGAITGPTGFYEINVWSPMFRMQVMEVGAGALDFTGHSVHDQFDRNVVYSQGNCSAADLAALETGGTAIADDCLPAELGGGLLLASIFQQGKRNTVDFGKLSYLDPNAPNGFFTGGDGHGGIAGGIINTITRAEWAGSLSGAEDNETGVPSTQVALYGLDDTCTLVDPVTGDAGADNPDCYTVLLDSTRTDSYQHPGIDRNGQTCPIPTAGGGPFSAINPNFDSVGDNCNGAWLLGAHTKDGAWNGGFAFTGMDPGFYVVEVVPPPGYQVVKENDLNTEEGNGYVPALPPAGCVGEYHYAQLDDVYGSPYDAFDDGGVYNGADPVRMCDRRLLRVQPFRNAAVDIMVMTDGMDRTWQSNFTGVDEDAVTPGYQQTPVDPYTVADQSWQSIETVPAPGRFFGLVLNDLTMTANQNALTFGEQQGVSNIPIGVYDATGGYVTTFWTDENGHYDVILPSTFSINRATPGGVGPYMYNLVINDPGPNGDTWGYDPAYITNPVVRDINPQNMTKADTPVLSLAAGPCALPTGTPQFMDISGVHGTTGSLPTVDVRGTDLAGASVLLVPQLADGTLDEAAAIDVSAHTSVLTQATPLDAGSFYDTVTIDLGAAEAAVGPFAGPYQVAFDDGTALGSTPRNTVTFHVLTPGGAYDLEVFVTADVVSETDTVIQDAIDAAAASTDPRGKLVVIEPGTYRESVVVPDPMVIQGHGSGGVIGVATEQGQIGQVETPYAFITGSLVSPFGALLDSRIYTDFMATIASISWSGNQGVEVGSGFQFLMEAGEVAINDAFQLDGVGITSVRAQNGAVHVNGHADGLVLSNLGIQANNASEGGAGINLGTHSSVTFAEVGVGNGTHGHVDGRVQPVAGGNLAPIGVSSDADNDGVVIRDNRILQNGGTSLAGGIGIFNGNDGYQLIDNDVCGNYAAEYGGGVSHVGVSDGTIARNAFQNNAAFDEGGALLIGGEVGFPAATDLGAGSGAVTVDANHVLYNLSGDDGGGVMVLNALESPLRFSNNVIGQNVATDVGGGVHLNNASAVTFVHNTVVENLSANSAEDAGGFACDGDTPGGTTNTCPRAGGLTSQPHSAGFTPTDASLFSDPLLQNNIFWNNQAGYVVAGAGGDPVQVFGTADLGVYLGAVDQGPAMQMNPEYSVLSVPYGLSATNVVGTDPQFVLELPLEIQSQPAPGLGAVGVIEMVYPGTSPIEEGDYHLASSTSPAADLGLADLEPFDIDGEARPFLGAIGDNVVPDAGADEVGAATVQGLMFFSTVRGTDGNTGFADEDIQGWSALGFETLFDGSTQGLTSGSADIDGLHVLSSTSILMSFLGNNVTLPGLASPVNDEDIVHYDVDADAWSLVVDGSAIGLTGGARDIDALHQLPDGSFLVSFAGFASLPTLAGPGTLGVPDEDVVRMIPVTSAGGTIVSAVFEPYFSGMSIDLDGFGGGDVDGVALVGDTLLLSTRGTADLDGVTAADEDVFACEELEQGAGGLWTCEAEVLYFDGTAEGLAGNNDVNAVSGPLGN